MPVVRRDHHHTPCATKNKVSRPAPTILTYLLPPTPTPTHTILLLSRLCHSQTLTRVLTSSTPPAFSLPFQQEGFTWTVVRLVGRMALLLLRSLQEAPAWLHENQSAAGLMSMWTLGMLALRKYKAAQNEGEGGGGGRGGGGGEYSSSSTSGSHAWGPGGFNATMSQQPQVGGVNVGGSGGGGGTVEDDDDFLPQPPQQHHHPRKTRRKKGGGGGGKKVLSTSSSSSSTGLSSGGAGSSSKSNNARGGKQEKDRAEEQQEHAHGSSRTTKRRKRVRSSRRRPEGNN